MTGIRLWRITVWIAISLLIGFAHPLSVQGAETGFSEVQVVSGLSNPSTMVLTPDGRIFVAEQGGTVRVIEDYALLPDPLLTLNVRAIDESGLVGMAIDPDFADNGYLYVYYTTGEQPAHNRLVRYTVHENRALPESALLLMEFEPLGQAVGHNGGGMHFGPDGKLYLGVGDNTYPPNSQALYNRSGKILRLNADGSIPGDNPFSGDSSVHPAIWAYGLRNPFSFAFEPGTGRMFINDVGSAAYEEINPGVAGANYGWPMTEGETDEPGLTGPLFVYPHEGEGLSGCAITSGVFYNPQKIQFPEDHRGTYFFTDYCRNWIKHYNPANDQVLDVITTQSALIVDLEVTPDGYLYYLAQAAPDGTGAVYRIDYAIDLPPRVVQNPTNLLLPAGDEAVFTCSAAGEAPLAYQWQRDGMDIPGATDPSYRIEAISLDDDGARLNCVASNRLGSDTSREAVLKVVAGSRPEAAILAPVEGDTYVAGQPLQFAGQASDPEDGVLSAEAFSWRIDYYQDRFRSPFMLPTAGMLDGSVEIPSTGQTATNVYYRVYLTVTDSSGLSTSTFIDVHPEVVQLTLVTDPPGLNLILDGAPYTTPIDINSVVGMQRSLLAPTQTIEGVEYVFRLWLDGAGAERTLVTPDQNTAFTAVFVPAQGPGS